MVGFLFFLKIEMKDEEVRMGICVGLLSRPTLYQMLLF